MQEILIYLVKMVLCSGLMFLYYVLFLKDRTFHHYNRVFLLITILISIVLPFVNIRIPSGNLLSGESVYVQTLDAITISPLGERKLNFGFEVQQLLLIIYLLVAALLVFRFLATIIKLYKISRHYSPTIIEGIKFYNTEEKNSPFSFFNHIFWNRRIELDSEKGRQIFQHELFHSKQLHSADLVIIQLLMSLAWFNPFFFLIKKELMLIHEYLADQYVISNNDPHQYAELLVLNARNQKQEIEFAHYFFHSPLKRRITMILKNSDKRSLSYLSRIMIIPLLLIIICSFAVQKNNSAQKNVSHQPELAISARITGDTVPLKKVEFESYFEGGAAGWQKFLINNLKYPKEAKGKEGAAVVTFIVNTDRTVEQAVLSKDPGFGLGDEALRVIKLSSGKWKPAINHGVVVRSYKMQPIIFKLEPQK